MFPGKGFSLFFPMRGWSSFSGCSILGMVRTSEDATKGLCLRIYRVLTLDRKDEHRMIADKSIKELENSSVALTVTVTAEHRNDYMAAAQKYAFHQLSLRKGRPHFRTGSKFGKPFVRRAPSTPLRRHSKKLLRVSKTSTSLSPSVLLNCRMKRPCFPSRQTPMSPSP